jgi:hypothetical protein
VGAGAETGAVCTAGLDGGAVVTAPAAVGGVAGSVRGLIGVVPLGKSDLGAAAVSLLILAFRRGRLGALVHPITLKRDPCYLKVYSVFRS